MRVTQHTRPIRLNMTGMNLVERMISNFARVSPRGAAIIDWARPKNHASWGGPMNGQIGRQHLVRELVKIVDIEAVIETGTYRGTTTEFLWHVTGRPVYSAECERRYFDYATRRFIQNPHVHLSLSDSRAFLKRLAADADVPKRNVLFYLDAHWGADLPLREECALIWENWIDSIVLIDDFEVPRDLGYGFDSYGEGKRLTTEYLGLDGMEHLAVLFPSLPSSLETGARRGCAVIVQRDLASSLLSRLPLSES
jgi:hypothetical protein